MSETPSNLHALPPDLPVPEDDEQREFAAREYLPYPLLNDGGFRLAGELGLPTFEVHGVRYYRRLTFIAGRGRIAKVFFPPQDNAAEVIAWLRSVGPVSDAG